MLDEKILDEALETFFLEPTWAEFYGCAPSGAKEIIALAFYRGYSPKHADDGDILALVKEVVEALDEEDLKYLIRATPPELSIG